ncbi:MAG TPA: metalloregulator ArsR/SmtB family transcription factor [Kofleriaceae bacterium]|nr:metalloregulator ArsR/SmtB family transcription factor [Kofleriaceae bacterium]
MTKKQTGHLPSADVLSSAVEVFKALGNSQRLSIIHALSHEEMSVGDLALTLGISMTVVSQSLAILRRLKLVAGRDRGRLTFYRVIDDVVSHLVHDCLEHCGANERAHRKRARRT